MPRLANLTLRAGKFNLVCMPRTIDEGFREFLSGLTPSSTESEAAKSHRASIKACIEKNYTLYRFVRIGSFGNGTSISGHSDVDYLAEVATGNLKENSSYSLTTLRDVLDARFPNTGVGVRCPAVRVPFGTNSKDTTEVVIGDDTARKSSGHVIYNIADCSGGWMDTAPDAHKAYVVKQDDRLGGKVRPLVRYIKAWKFYQSVPISSFYLEMRVAEYASGESSILYSIDVKQFLARLVSREMAALQDPVGVSGYIQPCKTQVQRDEAWSKLRTAATRAEKARDAEQAGKISDAFDWWRLLYNDEFPTYYY
ncbi:MAG: hypothetical protein JNG88_08395 [Phycisphaerales bacterium]|nr:hypothetical protein [Phycisphaerales bacterium]